MLVDQSRLNTLRAEVGEDVFAEVLEISVQELDEAIADLDSPNLAKLHFLKGSALNAGFAELSALCAVGEARLKKDPGAYLPTEQFLSIYAESRSHLLRILQTVVG